MFTRFAGLVSATLVASALAPAASPLWAAERPNILFIFTDDQSHRSVGCYEEAHPWVQTPNIDRLAAEGVRFEQAYAGTWCLPSRAMMLSGLQPHAINGLRVERNPVGRYDPNVCRFWPDELKRTGAALVKNLPEPRVVPEAAPRKR